MLIEHIYKIDALSYQINALLDLMNCSNEDCVSIKSIQVAADMTQTMFNELLIEIKKIEEELNDQH